MLNRDDADARLHAQNKAGGNHHYVNQHDVFEETRIGQHQQGVTQADQAKFEVQKESTRKDQQAQDDDKEDGCPGAQRTGSDRPELLFGMGAVRLDVDEVVNGVGDARNQAEKHKSEGNPPKRMPVAQLPIEDDPSENNQVLEPLPRPQGVDQVFKHGNILSWNSYLLRTSLCH